MRYRMAAVGQDTSVVRVATVVSVEHQVKAQLSLAHRI